MQLREPKSLADSLTQLRGDSSYGSLANFLYFVTDGRVDVDSLWLYRVSNSKVASLRKLATAEVAVLFGLAMMLHACRTERAVAAHQILRLGECVLVSVLGSVKLTRLILAGCAPPSDSLARASDLEGVLRQQIASWNALDEHVA